MASHDKIISFSIHVSIYCRPLIEFLSKVLHISYYGSDCYLNPNNTQQVRRVKVTRSPFIVISMYQHVIQVIRNKVEISV